MHTVTFVENSDYPSDASNMVTGDIAILQYGVLSNCRFLLKTYAGYVDLENPGSTWASLSDPKKVRCRILKPNSIVSIRIGVH